MTIAKTIYAFFKNHLFVIVSGIAAIGLFALSGFFLLKYSFRIDLIPFLDTPLKNTIMFAVLATMFLIALGEFSSNVGRFSFANYAVTTFLAALACYTITPALEVFTCLDLTDGNYVASALNESYGAWWKIYLIVYMCSLIVGMIVNRKKLFTAKAA